MLTFNIMILLITRNTGVAAYGIVANIAIIAIAVFTGVAQEIQPIISHLFGLKRSTDLKRNLIYSIITAVSLGMMIYLVIAVGSEQLISYFNRDNNPVLAEIADKGFLIYFVVLFFAGIMISAIVCLSVGETGADAVRVA